MQQPIQAIVFDCFGVILTDALSVLTGELEQRKPDVVQEMRAVIHAANKGIIEPEASTARVAELLGVTAEDYRSYIRNGEVRDQQLLDYIKTLRQDYKTAMLSNIVKAGMDRRFPNNELAEYFDEVVISGEIGYAKPDEMAYRITVERLGFEPGACIFTDDRPDYCLAAEQIGMRAIHYRSFPQFKQDLTEVLSKS